MEDGGRFADGAGIVLHLAGVDGVDHIGIHLVYGYANRGIVVFLPQLLFHPLQRFQIIFRQHPHLVTDLPLVLRHHSHTFRHDPDMHQQSARDAVERSHVHAHGAIDRAAAAVGALAENRILEVFQFLVGVHALGAHPPGEELARPVYVRFEQLSQLAGLVGRGIGRITGIGQHVMALIGAQSTVDARFQRKHGLAVDFLVHPFDQLLRFVRSCLRHGLAPDQANFSPLLRGGYTPRCPQVLPRYHRAKG